MMYDSRKVFDKCIQFLLALRIGCERAIVYA